MWRFLKGLLLTICLLCLTSAIHLSAQALTREEHQAKLNGLADRAKGNYIIKNYYSISAADFDHALQLTKLAAELSARNKWKDDEAYAEMYQGVTYFVKGDYESAPQHFLKAYHIFDSLQNYIGLARLCNEMAAF